MPLYNTQLKTAYSLAIAGSQPYKKIFARKRGYPRMGKA
jgi:hypothetical protein